MTEQNTIEPGGRPDWLEERPHEAQANEKNPISKTSIALLAVLALIFGLGVGGAGGWYARSGEVQDGQDAIAALEADVQKVRKSLRVAQEDLDLAQDDLNSANSRATEAERVLADCSEFADIQVENVLGLLDAMEAVMDNDYYYAIDLMDGLTPPRDSDKTVCDLDGSGEGA